MIFWSAISLVYMIFRCRGLRRGFKQSGKVSFIDFFEIDFMGRWRFGWRRKFKRFYNGKGYWVLQGIIMFLLLTLCIVSLVILLNLSGSDYSALLDYAW